MSGVRAPAYVEVPRRPPRVWRWYQSAFTASGAPMQLVMVFVCKTCALPLMQRSSREHDGRRCSRGDKDGAVYANRSRVFFMTAIPVSMALEMVVATLSGRKSAIQTTLLDPSSLAETCTDAL